MADKAAGANRPIVRNLATAVAGLAAAVATTIAAARLQPFAGPGYAAVTVFVLPLPVAIGLAAGLLSPRRTMLSVPVWAGMLSAVTILVTAGMVEMARSLPEALRLGLGAFGMVLSAAMGRVGEVSVERGRSRRAVALLVVGCALLFGLGHALVLRHARVYERSVLPELLLQVDADYLAIPAGLTWRCRRSPDLGCYEVSTELRGDRLRILAAPDGPAVLGILLDISGRSARIRDLAGARRYLTALGFREKLLSSLSLRKGTGGSWCAGLAFARLTLDPDGGVRVEPFPSFDARKLSLRR